jgi:hypothetical protein
MLQLTPALVRAARIEGGRLHLAGDTTASSPLEIWGPAFGGFASTAPRCA